jgi:fructokinase
MGYAVVLGEALVDLLETGRDGDLIYRQAIGGGPLNVAVGVTRLGGEVQYLGSLGNDTLGDRIAAFLRQTGVGTTGLTRVPVPTTLAVTTFDGAEPTFQFYGEPPSYALLRPEDVDEKVVADAAVVYTGSISLMREPFLAAARKAWAVPGPVRVFDPNVRPKLLPDAAAVSALRDLVEGFFATADMVKLSSADAEVLWDGAGPVAAAERILTTGAKAVVVTCGSKGAYVATTRSNGVMLPAPAGRRRPCPAGGLAELRPLRAGGGRPGLRTPGRRGGHADRRGAHRPLGCAALTDRGPEVPEFLGQQR